MQVNKPPLFQIGTDHHKVLELLISSGANLNLQNFQGKTALHLAAEKGIFH